MVAMYGTVQLLLLLGVFSGTYQQRSIEEALREIFPDSPVIEPNRGGCKCVPYYLCSSNNITSSDGRGVLDLRLKGNGPCMDYMDWCCDAKNIQTKAIPPNDTKNPGCGWRNKDGVGFRVIGDSHNETKFGEFPWTVAILQEETLDGISEVLVRYKCSGSLIHPQAIITSAHCVSDLTQNFIVRAGEWDTQTMKEIYPAQDRKVSSITIHPSYYSRALLNDIAFVVLDSPIDMAYPNVGIACLPSPGIIVQGNTRCFAIGWGKTSFGKMGRYQVILRKINLPIVDRTTCENNLRQTRLGRFFFIHKSFICAGGEEGSDTCTGDGGGPLMCPIPGQENRYEQVGIVAWGIGCGTKDVPSAYTNVPLFRNWIDQQIIHHNLKTSKFN